MTYLSTQDVASMIAVTESTVKRWADEGRIPCHRTLGGHRKFLLKDILAFAERNAYPLVGGSAPPLSKHQAEILEFSVLTKNYHKISQLLYDEALQGDRQGLYELLSYLTRSRVAFSTLADEIIRPAMVRIGEEWMQGKLEINREHLASNAIVEALIRLGSQLYHKPDNGLSAVCACVEGDHHEIGLRMVAYALEAEGWKVHYLGANTPVSTIRDFLKQRKPELMCISATTFNGSEETLRNLRSIGDATTSLRTAYVVGGLLPRQ